MTWRTSLRARLAFGSTALLFAALAAFGLLAYRSLADALYSYLDDSLRLSASQAVGMIKVQDGKIIPPGEFDNRTLSIDMLEHGLTIRILDSNGNNLQAVGPDRNNPLPAGVLRNVANGKTDLRSINDNDSPYLLRVYTAPITDKGIFSGAVEVIRPFDDIQAMLNRIGVGLLILIPLLALLVGLGVYLLTMWAMWPIGHMILAARQISTSGLPIQVNLPSSRDEVGQLVETFKVMMARLDESFQRERQFTADASHELRSPITAMQTIVQTTLGRPHTCEDCESALLDLANETNRLQRLTQNLLMLARNGSPRQGAFRPVNLSLLLMDVAESMRPVAEKKGLALQYSIPDGLSLPGDQDALIRLFVNLIDNAIKYTPDGQVWICAEKPPDLPELAIKIEDTGAGISSEHLPYIFERFYRGSAARSSTGSGLGLTIAREIVLAHHGKIEVSSHIGEGTTFLVHLPAEG